MYLKQRKILLHIRQINPKIQSTKYIIKFKIKNVNLKSEFFILTKYHILKNILL